MLQSPRLMIDKIRIVKAGNQDKQIWNEYIRNNSQSSIFHRFEWKNIVEATYNHRPIYLLALKNSDVVGVLPAFIIRSLIFGNKLVSLPFGQYAGPISDNKLISLHLIRSVLTYTKNENIDFFEIRTNPKNKDSYKLVKGNHKFYTFFLDISKGLENVLENAESNRRRAVKKSLKAGLEICFEEDIDNFFELYLYNSHIFGTPGHSKIFFENIVQHLSENTKIISVKKEGKVLASSILFLHNKYATSYSVVSRMERKYNVNDFLYIKSIEYCLENNIKYFDFGRSVQDSGVYKYKKRWNPSIIKLNYCYPLKGGKIPSYDLSSSKNIILTKLWSNFPLFFTQTIGPFFRKNLP